eukprot:144880-Rhodomonas_salina.2
MPLQTLRTSKGAVSSEGNGMHTDPFPPAMYRATENTVCKKHFRFLVQHFVGNSVTLFLLTSPSRVSRWNTVCRGPRFYLHSILGSLSGSKEFVAQYGGLPTSVLHER